MVFVFFNHKYEKFQKKATEKLFGDESVTEIPKDRIQKGCRKFLESLVGAEMCLEERPVYLECEWMCCLCLFCIQSRKFVLTKLFTIPKQSSAIPRKQVLLHIFVDHNFYSCSVGIPSAKDMDKMPSVNDVVNNLPEPVRSAVFKMIDVLHLGELEKASI